MDPGIFQHVSFLFFLALHPGLVFTACLPGSFRCLCILRFSHVCWALGFRIVRLIALRAQPLSFKTQTCAVSTHYIISCRVPVVVQSLPVCESCWSAYQDACHVRPVLLTCSGFVLPHFLFVAVLAFAFFPLRGTVLLFA